MMGVEFLGTIFINRYIVREPRSTREIRNYNFFFFNISSLVVPEVGITADTPKFPLKGSVIPKRDLVYRQ